jgi:ubiquinone/menaquinone biosynthesis C-methylase UbiE
MAGYNSIAHSSHSAHHGVVMKTVLPEKSMEEQDQTNRDAWVDPSVSNWLWNLQGFISAGERTAYGRIADEMRGKPILDLGVGGGRTIELMTAISTDYTAIDYLPNMVETSRRKFPGVDIQQGDARDLSRFADNRFALVTFSYMGIDAVDHEGRGRVLAEVHRVLQPGGVFWFSTMNKTGCEARQRPWKPRWPRQRGHGLRRVKAIARTAANIPGNTRNYLRLRKLAREGNGWMLAPFYPHRYRLLVHYTTLEQELAELESAGFRGDPEVFEGSEGKRVHVSDDLSEVGSFNILARKKGASRQIDGSYQIGDV